MAEAVVEVEVKAIDQLTVKELRIVCRQKGIKGYSDMTKAEILEAIQGMDVTIGIEAVGEPMAVAVEETEMPEPETPKSPWNGFLPELSSVCSAFDELDAGNFLPAELLEVVSAARDNTTVAAFDQYTEDAIVGMIGTLRNQLPRYQREVFETIALIGTARPMVIDVDFI